MPLVHDFPHVWKIRYTENVQIKSEQIIELIDDMPDQGHRIHAALPIYYIILITTILPHQPELLRTCCFQLCLPVDETTSYRSRASLPKSRDRGLENPAHLPLSRTSRTGPRLPVPARQTGLPLHARLPCRVAHAPEARAPALRRRRRTVRRYPQGIRSCPGGETPQRQAERQYRTHRGCVRVSERTFCLADRRRQPIFRQAC